MIPSQVAINAITAGMHYALVGGSFALVHRAVRFFHLAHGAVFTASAYCCYWLMASLGLRPMLALFATVIFAGGFGALIDSAVYRPLRSRGSSNEILLLASFGVLIVVQNLVSLLFGDSKSSMNAGRPFSVFDVLGGRMTSIQIVSCVSSTLVCVGLWAFLQRTRAGAHIRAAGVDPELAAVLGIERNVAARWALAVGSAAVAAAAVLHAWDVDATPAMGLHAVLWGAVAAVVGGVGNVPGAFAAGLLLGGLQHFSSLVIPAQWAEGLVFAGLIGVLLFRPEGLRAARDESRSR